MLVHQQPRSTNEKYKIVSTKTTYQCWSALPFVLTDVKLTTVLSRQLAEKQKNNLMRLPNIVCQKALINAVELFLPGLLLECGVAAR